MNNKLIINTNLLRKEPEFKTYTWVVEKAVPVPTEEFERLKHAPNARYAQYIPNAKLLYENHRQNHLSRFITLRCRISILILWAKMAFLFIMGVGIILGMIIRIYTVANDTKWTFLYFLHIVTIFYRLCKSYCLIDVYLIKYSCNNLCEWWQKRADRASDLFRALSCSLYI